MPAKEHFLQQVPQLLLSVSFYLSFYSMMLSLRKGLETVHRSHLALVDHNTLVTIVHKGSDSYAGP